MEKFASGKDFLSRISTAFTFESPWRRLGRFRIFLMCLASGDFNPAHCRSGFEQNSFFRGIVSHGIGIFNRAEGAFVGLLTERFFCPVEIIALGYDEIRYRAPLRLGDEYRYRFEIRSANEKKGRFDMECRIICETPNGVVAEAEWLPSLIEHAPTKAARKYLVLKSYGRNVLEVMGGFAAEGFVAVTLVVMLISSFALHGFALTGNLPDDLQMAYAACSKELQDCFFNGP